MKKVLRTFRISADLVEQFDQVAQQEDVDKTSVIIEAIEKFVKENKMYYVLFDESSLYPPSFINEDAAYEFDLYEGKYNDVIEEAYERNARVIHSYEKHIDEYDFVTYKYIETLSNLNYRKGD